ncbi:MAG: YbaY family lipoprotein [Planctomycetaceae bacterium]
MNLALLGICVSNADAQWIRPPTGQGGWQQPNRWQLGVAVQNTQTGVVVTQVLPGSVAANVGFSVGDRILAVAGHQVGYVDGRLVDLGDEVAQHVGPNGDISMLVLTARGGLQSTNISMAASGSVIRGTAMLTGLVNLSRQTVLQVTMRDASHNQWGSAIVAQTTVPAKGGNPIAFELPYTANQVFPGHRYAIEAELVDRGRVLQRSVNPAIVVPGANQQPVALVLQAATAPLPGGGNVAIPYDQIRQWYRSYLRRDPTAQELATWQNHLQSGRSLADVQTYLLGSSEYDDRHQNDPQQYLRNVYTELNGADPTQQQMQAWQQQLEQSGGARSRVIQKLRQPQQ